jgi:hypothetical protein
MDSMHTRNQRSGAAIASITSFASPFVVLLAAGAIAAVACGRGAEAVTPEAIEQQYGVSGAHTDDVSTPQGSIRGTVVPVTLADGRQAQLFIPPKLQNDPHGVYVRDEEGLHPVHLRENATRDEIARAPTVVERRPEPEHEQKRSWEKDALVIGGSAGAGTLIGAVAGGKKGAAVGVTAGGIGGLIYDLATRKK